MKGDPAWQAEWELLAILISLIACVPHESRAPIVVQSDGVAALSVAVKLSSPKVLMNAPGAEIALVLNGLSTEVILIQRIWGCAKC